LSFQPPDSSQGGTNKSLIPKVCRRDPPQIRLTFSGADHMTSTISVQRQVLGRGKLAFSTEWLNPTAVRISVRGEIDATNEAELRDYVFRRAANCQILILNLHEVSFFSTAGFSALLTIDERCTRAAVNWMVVPSAAVSRVLDICDREFAIPCGAI